MKAAYSKRFLHQYAAAPSVVKRAFSKQVELLLGNLQHPSLHAKKYDESNDIWQARINRDWRFYFRIQGGIVQLLQMMKHPK
jgi:hypothetical protein